MSEYAIRKYKVSVPDEGDWYIAYGPYYFLGNYSNRGRALRVLNIVRDYERSGFTPEEIYPLIGIDEGFEAEDFPGRVPYSDMEDFRR